MMSSLLLLLLLLPGCERPPAPPTGPPTPEFTIVHVGDINLSEDVSPILAKSGGDFMFRYVRPLLAGDLRMGNLETVVASAPALEPIDKKSRHLMDPEYLPVLKQEGFDVLSIANNHAMDQRADKMLEMVGRLDDLGLRHVGAGATLEDAMKPVIVHGAGLTIAIIGVYNHTRQKSKLGWYASDGTPGVWGLNKGQVRSLVKRLKGEEGVDFVFASVHWGPNYEAEGRYQRWLAQALVHAGVDAINGTGGHMQQGVDFVSGVPVLYGIGNFTFGSHGVYEQRSPDNRLSSVARWVFKDRRLQRVELMPLRTDNKRVKYQARPAGEEQRRREFEPVLSRYGVPWSRREDGWYVIPVPERSPPFWSWLW